MDSLANDAEILVYEFCSLVMRKAASLAREPVSASPFQPALEGVWPHFETGNVYIRYRSVSGFTVIANTRVADIIRSLEPVDTLALMVAVDVIEPSAVPRVPRSPDGSYLCIYGADPYFVLDNLGGNVWLRCSGYIAAFYDQPNVAAGGDAALVGIWPASAISIDTLLLTRHQSSCEIQSKVIDVDPSP